MKAKTKVVLISHTHWDREWYYTFDKYRYRLVACVDKLLEILEKKPDFKCFVFDGQVAPIEDYLEVRPENREKLVKYISKGRIKIGPWYIQPDEFLVSGESLVRNLMLGIRTASKYGGYMKVGYLPDIFGHTAQMPQILRGFGIDNFFFHRGMGPEFENLGMYFKWVAPSGDYVYTVFLYGGYGTLLGLPDDPEKATEMIRGLVERLKDRANVPVIPGMIGCDHAFPKEWVPNVENYARKKDLPFVVEQGSLEDVVEVMKSSEEKLGEYKGELLSSHYHSCLYGVWSARIYLKQLCFGSEVKLTHLVEPLWALAWLLEKIYPSEFIWRAWKYLILSQPHDSICGCSTDEVHKEVESRLLKASTLADELLECTGKLFNVINYFTKYAGINFKKYALPVINSHVKLDFSEDSVLYLVAYNTLPWPRREIVRFRTRPELELTREYLENLEKILIKKPPESLKNKIGEKLVIDYRKYALKTLEGKIIPYQVRELEDGGLELVWVDDIPSFGLKAYALVPRGEEKVETDIKVGENWIENEFFKVSFNEDHGGAIRIEDKRTGAVYEDLNIFEDGGDIGDEYDYSPPAQDTIVESSDFKASVEIIEKGPYVATAKVTTVMEIPRGLTEDRKARSNEKVKLPITVFVSLYSKVPRIDVKVVVENYAKDHRLRVKFPVGVDVDTHFAETHFYVVERPNKPIYYYIRRDGTKAYIATQPTRLWIDVNDGKKGLCVATKGLPEYEVRKKNGETEILVTLMRCIGWLSRSDLLTRPGGAGPHIPTKDSQMIGIWVFEYSIIPHSGTWLEAEVYKTARNFIVPVLVHEDFPHSGEIEPVYSFMKIEPSEAVVSAFKKAEDDDSIILRLFNISGKETEAKITFSSEVAKAWITNLNEEIVSELNSIEGNTIKVKLGAHKIITLKIVLKH